MILGLALLLFLASCVFDPADRMLGLKVELFVACWALALFFIGIRRERLVIPVGLLLYTLAFMLIPMASIAWYYVSDGREPFEGFALLKGYVLITLGVLLFLNRINLLPHLSAMLTLLAAAIAVVFVAVTLEPGLIIPAQIWGDATGVMFVTERDYGSGLVLLQVYFATSPMLVIPIAYYFHLAWSAVTKRDKVFFTALTAMNCVAMFVAGSRNNIAVSLLLPLALYVFYSRNKIVGGLLSAALSVYFAVLYREELRTLLDPGESSNLTKLSMLQDYREVLTDPASLFLGQGLGAYYFWEAKGRESFISELTYLELIRNFGLLGALIMMGLLLYPLIYALIINKSFGERHIVIAYAFYLLVCFSNPNLFSSMGILILSAILANIFLNEGERSGFGGLRA